MGTESLSKMHILPQHGFNSQGMIKKKIVWMQLLWTKSLANLFLKIEWIRYYILKNERKSIQYISHYIAVFVAYKW